MKVSVILFENNGVEEVVEVWDDFNKAENRLEEILSTHDVEFERRKNTFYSKGDEFGSMTYRIVTEPLRN